MGAVVCFLFCFDFVMGFVSMCVCVCGGLFFAFVCCGLVVVVCFFWKGVVMVLFLLLLFIISIHVVDSPGWSVKTRVNAPSMFSTSCVLGPPTT